MTSETEQKFDVKSFAMELREDLEKNRIRLPTLPAISLEALLVVNDAGSSMADVAKIISKDTSMATRLVRYANSPLYGGINKVTSVKTAITRIGFDAVKHAILSLAMKDVFTTSYKPIQNRMESLWSHSVKVASMATMLASHFPHLNKDEAMLAGLIHDVGVIPILIKAQTDPVLSEQEDKLDKVISALHMLIGKFLLQHWNFDKSLIDVASNHDKLDRKPSGDAVDYVDIIQVANILSYEGSEHQYAQVNYRQLPAFKRVGLNVIDSIIGDIEAGETERHISSTLTS